MKSFATLVGYSLLSLGLASASAPAHAQYSPTAVMTWYAIMDNASDRGEKPAVQPPKAWPGVLRVEQGHGTTSLRVETLDDSYDNQGQEIAAGQGVQFVVPAHNSERTVRVLYAPRPSDAAIASGLSKSTNDPTANANPAAQQTSPSLPRAESFKVEDRSDESFVNSERLTGFRVQTLPEGKGVDLVFPPSTIDQAAVVVMSRKPDNSMFLSVSAGLNTHRGLHNVGILFGGLMGLSALVLSATRGKNERQSPLQRWGQSVVQGVRRRRPGAVQ